jgi:hypothetical protein
VPEAMRDALMLAAALSLAVCGMAWFALAMHVHWQQVRRSAPSRRAATLLRLLGVLALLASLFVCLRADHVTMAPLVWLMALAGAALLVAFVLAWRAQWLAPLVAWLPVRDQKCE